VQHDLWTVAIGVHKPESRELASGHQKRRIVLIKTQLVHPLENSFAVLAATGRHPLIHAMKKEWKDLILILVEKNHSW
tara:strand:+ start:93 stop:326 length:234 start_codon:yes stop_codon:yes gene_type:complete